MFFPLAFEWVCTDSYYSLCSWEFAHMHLNMTSSSMLPLKLVDFLILWEASYLRALSYTHSSTGGCWGKSCNRGLPNPGTGITLTVKTDAWLQYRDTHKHTHTLSHSLISSHKHSPMRGFGVTYQNTYRNQCLHRVNSVGHSFWLLKREITSSIFYFVHSSNSAVTQKPNYWKEYFTYTICFVCLSPLWRLYYYLGKSHLAERVFAG